MTEQEKAQTTSTKAEACSDIRMTVFFNAFMIGIPVCLIKMLISF